MADTLPMVAPIALTTGSRDSLVGLKLNGFVITGAVSAGGMGVVYEARHPLIGRRAAVKVIRPELGNDVELSARFLREARAVSAVKHQNVVEILDFGALPDGAQYMMMEFLEGDTLAEVIDRDAPMHPAQALHICEGVLSGLSAAHQVGVVHRDLKPANIVLMKQTTGELIVKVLDFGLARQLDSAPEPTTRESLRELASEKSSLLAGTPEYISPEQASGEQVGAQGDLYGVGVILFEMLCGRLPFTSPSPWDLMQLHRTASPPSLSSLIPEIDPQLELLVSKLLKKDPAERPLGARQALGEVTRLVGLLDQRRAAAPGRRNRRVLRLGGAVVVGTLALGLGLSWIVWPEPAPMPGSAAIAMPAPAPPPAPKQPPDRLLSPPSAAVASTPAIKPRPRLASASSCVPTESWRRAIREQLEDLEKLSLARMTDDAPPPEVAKIKQRARGIATSLKNARGAGCEQVEGELRAWRMALK